MRLITFNHGAHTRLGVLNGDRITDLSRAAPDLPTEMNALLHAGDGAMQAARAAAGDDFALHEVELLSPVSQPGKILAVALNYRDHLEEVQEAMQDNRDALESIRDYTALKQLLFEKLNRVI